MEEIEKVVFYVPGKYKTHILTKYQSDNNIINPYIYFNIFFYTETGFEFLIRKNTLYDYLKNNSNNIETLQDLFTNCNIDFSTFDTYQNFKPIIIAKLDILFSLSVENHSILYDNEDITDKKINIRILDFHVGYPHQPTNTFSIRLQPINNKIKIKPTQENDSKKFTLKNLKNNFFNQFTRKNKIAIIPELEESIDVDDVFYHEKKGGKQKLNKTMKSRKNKRNKRRKTKK